MLHPPFWVPICCSVEFLWRGEKIVICLWSGQEEEDDDAGDEAEARTKQDVLDISQQPPKSQIIKKQHQ